MFSYVDYSKKYNGKTLPARLKISDLILYLLFK